VPPVLTAGEQAAQRPGDFALNRMALLNVPGHFAALADRGESVAQSSLLVGRIGAT